MDVSELEHLVRSNIQEVLSLVDQPGSGSATYDGLEKAPSMLQHEQLPEPCTSDQPGASVVEVPQNSEATIRLLKARVRALEEHLNTVLMDNAERDAEISELQKQAKLHSQHEAAGSKAQKALEAQVERYKKAAEAAREALAAKEQQVKDLSKEGSKADKDRRLLEQESRSRDVRLQRALEEVDKYKQLLQDVKHQGQEVKDVARSDYNKAVNEVKRLERQKGELMGVLRKQAKLIDVLRRQRAHLEAARLLAFTEGEFHHMLNVSA